MRNFYQEGVQYEVDDEVHEQFALAGIIVRDDEENWSLSDRAVAGPRDVAALLDPDVLADSRQHFSCCLVRWKDSVLLVKKNHPEWQSGRWNGVGGRLEEGETAKQCAIREWEEETKSPAPELTEFLVLEDSQVIVHFFRGTLDSQVVHVTELTNDIGEELRWESLSTDSSPVWCHPTQAIDNLTWLVPMAMSDQFHMTGRVIAWRRGPGGEPVL